MVPAQKPTFLLDGKHWKQYSSNPSHHFPPCLAIITVMIPLEEIAWCEAKCYLPNAPARAPRLDRVLPPQKEKIYLQEKQVWLLACYVRCSLRCNNTWHSREGVRKTLMALFLNNLLKDPLCSSIIFKLQSSLFPLLDIVHLSSSVTGFHHPQHPLSKTYRIRKPVSTVMAKQLTVSFHWGRVKWLYFCFKVVFLRIWLEISASARGKQCSRGNVKCLHLLSQGCAGVFLGN